MFSKKNYDQEKEVLLLISKNSLDKTENYRSNHIFQKLQIFGFIEFDLDGEVQITPKGRHALDIGLTKFMDFEEFEARVGRISHENQLGKNFVLVVCVVFFLSLILSSI